MVIGQRLLFPLFCPIRAVAIARDDLLEGVAIKVDEPVFADAEGVGVPDPLVVTQSVDWLVLQTGCDCVNRVAGDMEQATPVHLRTQSSEQLLGKERACFVMSAENDDRTFVSSTVTQKAT